MIRIINGDMLAELPKLEADSIDSCVTDPPYHLTSIVKRFGSPNAAPAKGNAAYIRASAGFMGKTWDGGDIALRPETWAEVWRVLKPGAYLLAFGGTRTYHRMACAIEDAGFEIRDASAWLYGSGFPKSLDVSKAIDKAAGVKGSVVPQGEPVRRMIPGADQNKSGWTKDNGRIYQPGEYVPSTDEAAAWVGWGTALKPAMELICVARKPLSERTVAANVRRHGTGAINVDACRVATNDALGGGKTSADYAGCKDGWRRPFQDDAEYMTERASIEQAKVARAEVLGRWPANVCHDGSEEVLAAFAESGQRGAAAPVRGNEPSDASVGSITGRRARVPGVFHGDSGTASRFFYTAKADSADRQGSNHPTVKPTDLMRWLVKLVTPPGGTVLDPFCGTGSTLLAADQLQFNAIGIEQDATYAEDARRKLTTDAPLFAEVATPATPTPSRANLFT